MQAARFADDWREDQVILPINIHYFWLASQYQVSGDKESPEKVNKHKSRAEKDAE
jgi:hypothetical protein